AFVQTVDHFQLFTKRVQSFAQGDVDFSGNDIKAKETIAIAINSVDLKAREFRLAELENAFFKDLSNYGERLVVSLDTYQSATEEFVSWIEGKWLRAVDRRLKNVATVIAGQVAPDPNHVVWGDECEHFHLKPILDCREWQEFWSELSEDVVKGIAIVGEGHPKRVHEMLQTVTGKWSA
ncbi:MAG: hypothetical protein AAGA67_10390, partial [Cyanobacteria bacterium P01_F01_bin.153]